MLRSPEIKGDVNLNPPHWFLGWELRASRGPHAWADGAHVHKFSTVSIAVLRGAYVCTCVTLTPPPDEAVIFSSLLLSLAVATSTTGTTGWWRATCLSPTLSAQLIVIDSGTALTFLEYRAVLTSPARPLFSRTSCRETGWIEQRHTIASLTSEPLSHSQNKCKNLPGWALAAQAGIAPHLFASLCFPSPSEVFT